LFRMPAEALSKRLGNAFQSDGMALDANFDIQDKMVGTSQTAGSGLVSFVAGTLFVTSTNSNLQDVIDSAPPGFTVNVEAGGTYSDLAVGDKPITLAFENGPTLTLVQEGGQTNLYITGTPGEDSIDIDPGNTATDVVVSFGGLPAISFAPSGQIVAQGGNGDDTITGSVANELIVDGGAGHDVITGGSGNTYVVADAGNDEVIPGSGTTSVVVSLPPQVADDHYLASTGTKLSVTGQGVFIE